MFKKVPKNCRYGYGRVSSKSQEDNSSLESQKQEFIQQGVPEKNIRIEIGSAADPIKERPVFQKLIDQELKENDLLFVTKIDRCSRNTLEFLKLQEKLFKRILLLSMLGKSHSITSILWSLLFLLSKATPKILSCKPVILIIL